MSLLTLFLSSHASAQSGIVYAFGNNTYGEIGQGYFGHYRAVPTKNPLLSNITQIDGRGGFVVVVKSDGTVWQWGSPSYYAGQAVSESLKSPLPIQVPGLTGVVQVVSNNGNFLYALALKSNGTVWGWGDNTFGTVGNGTTTVANAPVQASGLTGVSHIATGYAHALALKADGTVWAWGSNSYGQLGDGTNRDRLVPTRVQGLTNVAKVYGGNTLSFAIKKDGTLWSWGGDTTKALPPTQVTGLANIVQLAVGEGHVLALQAGGAVFAQGDNTYGQLGIGNTLFKSNFVQIPGLTGITQVSAGRAHSLALKSNGAALAWGRNQWWTIGDGTSLQRNSPTPVSILTSVKEVSAGWDSSFACRSDGSLWVWGGNYDAQLGLGTGSFEPLAKAVKSIRSIVEVAAGAGHNLALSSDGTVWAWGSNLRGQIGDGTLLDRNEPVQVSNLTGVVHITAGAYSSFAIKADGTLWAWGLNGTGQLGDGTNVNRTRPVAVQGISAVVQVAASEYDTMALCADGTVWAWGWNRNYEAGNGTTISRTTPQQVPGLQDITQIAMGPPLALKSDGTAYYWASNAGGNGLLGFRKTPTKLLVESVVSIAAGYGHGHAITSSGKLWSWGQGDKGQLGDGSTNTRLDPVLISGVTEAVQVAAGGTFTLVLKSDGTLMSCGVGPALGNGTHRTVQTQFADVPNLTNQTYISAGGTSLSVQMTTIATEIRNTVGAMRYLDALNISASLSEARGLLLSKRPLSFSVDGTAIGILTTNAKGEVLLTVKDTKALHAGERKLVVQYGGDRLYKPFSLSTTFTISKALTKLPLPSVTISPGESKSISAKLTRIVDGAILNGMLVKFSLDGTVLSSARTDATGVAKITYKAGERLKSGVYSLAAEFAGAVDHAASKGDATFTIAKAETAVKTTDVSGNRGASVTLVGEITRTTDALGLASRELHFWVDDKEIGVARTDSKGKANFVYKIPTNMSKGKHTLKVTFTGDDFYNKSSSVVKTITVN
jgi:alpha-tubulin suppressor-like RCC1 family protein